MITTAAHILESFKNSMLKTLPKFDEIQHAGMFGAMYEGLSRDTLERSLFEGLDLRVVEGKIRGQGGELSRQIDCMVVFGQGETIPFTSSFVYTIENVILIMEVKKKLFGRELDDSIELFRDLWRRINSGYRPRLELLRETWAGMFKEHLPTPEQAKELPVEKQYIYHSLVTEAILPVRVVLAYEGYSDEQSLRKGFIDYMHRICEVKIEERR